MRKNRINRGFSLIEIITVMIIIGIVAVVAVPNYMSSAEVSKAQSAENNLYAIAAAQQKFSEDYNGSFCTNTFAPPSGNSALCGDSAADLSVNLHLNLSSNDPFFANYQCTASIGSDPAGTLYRCTTNDGIDTLTLLASATANTVSCTPAGSRCPS